MQKIISILKDNKALKALLKGQGDIFTNETSDEAYLIASAFLLSPRTMIIVKENQYQALSLYRQLNDLLNDVCYYPADESLRVESIAYSYELLGERVNALYKLSQDKPVICICHMHSLIRYVSAPALFKENILSLKTGDVIDPLDLREKLVHLGYKMTQRVDTPFYMSRRGGVIDIYSIQYDAPLRIEFFDDEIETISFFDKDTQRRTEKIPEAVILPATDMLYDESSLDDVLKRIEELKEATTIDEDMRDELQESVAMDEESLKNHDYSPRIYQYMSLFDESSSLLDYAPDALLITASYAGIMNQYKRFTEENYYYFKEIQEIGEMIEGLSLVHDPQDLLHKKHMDFAMFRENDKQISFLARPVQISTMNEKIFINQLKDYMTFNKVLICVEDPKQIEMMTRLFEDNNLSCSLVGHDTQIYKGLNLYMGSLHQGIELSEERVVVLTSNELFKTTVHKKGYVKYKDAKAINDYNELNIGDYVVHDTNGIGQYMGIKTLEVKGVHKDFLYIAYKGNDVLYVPVENFRLIRKYASREGKVPHVHSLGSTKWQKEKARVREKVDGLADELIALYAQRMKQPGFAFAPDSELQMEFEQGFGYALTPDQEKAVKEIKADMELPRPMDRLLCGDVGFGKTEVALRACFKAILSNKQCAFLCPTTILSSQHFHTMTKRFEGFPVRIALLNRFTTTKEKNQMIKDLKAGRIDLLVGTHRILSQDIVFKDLGLLCIDEEQRFGVKQKEKIKEIRQSIDVLTLTATPIPRTLQMSLMGIRGLSQIETPPLNRLPVQTYVNERSLPLIKQVIERELARGGQVFFLHNRTENIVSMANMIATMLPEARVGVGHGKMKKEQLEDVMQDFIDKKFDVLVCTTIIETGIDIPNANTIVIEDADRFGLAQLYQIKGRVGRSERIAYAYLLYRKNKLLNEEATKRLKAIKEFTQLGSGYKIAMRDLSIRGSGDILGGEQAGFIDSVGFDMYMKILQEALDEKQGKQDQEKEIPASNVAVDGYIPSDYVESDMEKLELYQRIYRANHLGALKSVEDELKDLYGELPREVSNIVIKRRFEILSHDPIIDKAEDKPDGLWIQFTKDFSDHVQGEKLFELANRLFKKPQLKYMQNRIAVVIENEPHYIAYATEFLNTLTTDQSYRQ